MDFQKKNVWITGASSGLGEAMARAFAKDGAYLIISARSVDKLEALKKELEPLTKVHIEPLDLGKHDELPEVVDRVYQRFRQIDILINNGGISQRSLALETDISVVQRIMDINFVGTVHLAAEVAKRMSTARQGHQVVISSLVGKFSSPLRTSYSASKHALHGYFDGLRAELTDRNVKITIICPGYIKTDVSKNALTGDGSKQGKMDEKTGKGMLPERFAQKALRAIRKEKAEVTIGGFETNAVWINRLFPGIFRRIIRKAKVT